jgi:protein gp37
MAKRLKGRYGYPKDDPFRVTVHQDKLEEPYKWIKPSKVFICSMGDLFHNDVGICTLQAITRVVRDSGKHTFMILTKRPKNMLNYFSEWDLAPDNLLLGISVEDQKTADERIPILLQIPAAKHFISVEPMLGPIEYMTPVWMTLDWIICGGETGPGARPMHPDWVRSLRDQCQEAGAPFFFKSWGEWAHERNLGIVILEDPEEPKRLIQYGIDQISHPVPMHTEGYQWPDGSWSVRVGKKNAGHLLDGKEHREVPK